jgi:hypothetical protein
VATPLGEARPRNVSRLALVVRMSVVAGCMASVGCEWKQRSTNGPLREGHAMAFDPIRNQVMMFGGKASNGDPLNDTWEWNGSVWTNVTPSAPGDVNPDPRFKPAMACDPARNRVVLFGGVRGEHELDDTWEWDGTKWTKPPASGPSPPGRHHHAMAYDPINKVILLFGGFSGSGADPDHRDLDDTWGWNGTVWIKYTPVTSPGAREAHAMAVDTSRMVVVLFGGAHTDAPFFKYSDTWEWNGAQWAEIQLSPNIPTNSPPSKRGGHAMAYNEKVRRLVLFGGLTESAQFKNDSYHWNVAPTGTKRWQQYKSSATAPSGRYDHAMAYDSRRSCLVMFGGRDANSPALPLGDTWELAKR